MHAQFALTEGARPRVTVVHGSDRAQAERTAEALFGSDQPVSIVPDSDVLEPGVLQLRESYLNRDLILVGSIYSNRAVLMLACRRLVAANSACPGPGRYELRALFSPLRRGSDMLVVGVDGEEGFAAALQRLRELVETNDGERSLPALLEFGPGKPARPKNIGGGFDRQAFAYVWEANTKALDKAREFLKTELERPVEQGLWGFRAAGHYSWERHYVGLLQLAAAGVLAPDVLTRLNGRLVDLALRNTDLSSVAALNPQSEPDAYTRHPMSALASQFLLHEYLHHRAALPPECSAAGRQQLRVNLEVLRRKLLKLAEDHRYRMESSEGFSCMETLSNLDAMYLHMGLLDRMADAGIFRRQVSYAVAMRDNLNSDPGTNAYIACRPGSQFTNTVGGAGIVAEAFARRAPETVWLCRHHKLPFTYLGVTMPPGMLSPPVDAQEAFPAAHTGLELVPHDPWFFERYVSPETHPYMVAGETVEPYHGLPGNAFSKAVFRDGFEPDDGYLLMQGENVGPSFLGAGPQGNAICRYTELGSLLLFQNVQKVTSWARSVVSISRGQHDPVSAACSVEASFKTPRLQGMSSALARNGGATWTRHVLRRRRAYFAVFDEARFTDAAAEGTDYQVVCRWRSYHPGRKDDDRHFSALDGGNGTELHIVTPEPLVTDVTLEPRDGAARPTMLRQYLSGRYRKDARTCFRNLLYATNDARRRSFDVRPQGTAAMLVNGVAEGTPVVDLIAVGSDQTDGLPESDAALRVLSGDGCVWAGCRSLRIGDTTITSDQPVTVVLDSELSACVVIVGGAQAVLTGQGGAIVDGEGLSAAGRTLSPGRHVLQIPGTNDVLERVGVRLRKAWEEAAVHPVAGAAKEDISAPLSARPAKTQNMAHIAPRHAIQRTVRVSANPEPLDGHPYSWARNPQQWFDRDVPWMGAEVPGWQSGSGEILLDFMRPVAVRALRFFWPGYYQSHRFKVEPLKPAELAVRVAPFTGGVQEEEAAAQPGTSGTAFAENAHYMSTARFPTLTVPVDLPPQQRLRVSVQPKPDARRSRVLFSEIEVISSERESRVDLRLRSVPQQPRGHADVVAWSPTHLLVLDSRERRLIAEVELSAPVVDAMFADIDGDGVSELLVYTLDDRFTAYNSDGHERFQADMSRNGDGDRSWISAARPACFIPWRPNAQGNSEYLFFPHYSMGRLSPEPELEVSWPTQGHTWGGKAAVTVPDLDGDGREDVLVIGLYSRCHRLLASTSDLENGACKAPAQRSYTGYSSGNMELPLYFSGHVVRRPDSTPLLIALTPGGIDCLSYPELAPVWRHFNHPPNECSALWRTDDGEPALVVGRGDGFVARYRVRDGVLLDVFRVGRGVRALAVVGDVLVVGGPDGLVVLTPAFAVAAKHSDPVDAVCATGDRLVVGYSSGDIAVVVPE
ncbi:MAG: hypothetical protein HN742_41240 [Lentisphaerae bacterium]|nr:hypothetical protein [Lentisphaerota bacterium]MBT4816046.1 hypothetical protein [Lentisphaerota bacterium]MBT5608379.1 hypothetical protein [Lentisphaerota bacterium]MBT7060996.1 hypothetical protein [Lentisphaerota bacterium]MBT7848363.1 hypothetical protein [Lentisphaerota bacterium]